MDSKKIGFCILIIIILIVIGLFFAINQTEDTQIKILSNSSLYNGEDVVIQLTTENGTPISNQSVNVTLIDANGGKNVQKLVTDEEGKASFTLGGVTVGNYTLECCFGGNTNYNPSNITSHLQIKEKIVELQKTKKSNVVGETIEFNAQAGEGYFREVSYSDGNIRQYDVNTGKLIGSTYRSDQKYLEQRY